MNAIRTGLVAGLLVCGSATAQGDFQFDDIPGISSAPAVQIDLNPQMLNFVRAAAGAGGEQDAVDMLAGIERVRVRVFEELDDPEAVADFVDDSSKRLDRDGWQPAVSIQDEGSRVRMYLRFDGDNVSGMSVMVVDEEDAVFIDIDGTIDPTRLGQLMNQMGVEGVLENIGSPFVAGFRDAAGQAASGD